MKKLSKKSITLFALAMALVALALPAMSSASTAVPGLVSGDTQAFIANSGGTHIGGTTTVSGPLTLTGAATISCTGNTFGVTWLANGTATVTSFAASGCTVSGFPSCTVTIGATSGSLPWGVRFFRRVVGTFRHYINAAFDVRLSGTCPATGTFPFTPTGGANGLLPTVSISGTTITVTFDSGAGSVTNATLGRATISGSVRGTVPSGSNLTV